MSNSLPTTPCHCTSANASATIKIRRNDPYSTPVTTPVNAYLSLSTSSISLPKLDDSDDTFNLKLSAHMSTNSLNSNASTPKSIPFPSYMTGGGAAAFPSERAGRSLRSGGESPNSQSQDDSADCALLDSLACSRRAPVPSRSARLSRTPSIVTPSPSEADSQPRAGPPTGTIHAPLWDTVTFVPYPTEEFVTPSDAIPAIPEMNGDTSPTLVRAFFGQLPYFVTNMQLSWLLYTFGGKHTVLSSERIIKKNPVTGVKLPTGCVHAYCTRLAIEEITALMHKKLLVDDTGIWVGQTPEEADALARYVEMHRRDKSMRVPNRAYDTMVVQLATSTFIPRRVLQMAALQKALHCTDASQETPDVGPRFQSREEAEVHCQQRASSPQATPTPSDGVFSPQTHYPTNPSPNSRSSNFSGSMSPQLYSPTYTPQQQQQYPQPTYSPQAQYPQYSPDASQMQQYPPQQQQQWGAAMGYHAYQQQQPQPQPSSPYLTSPPEYGVGNDDRGSDLPW